MGSKKKYSPLTPRTIVVIFLGVFLYPWKLWLFKYFTLLQFAVSFFYYIDLFLSISVSEITMDFSPLPECGLHKKINFNSWSFQISQTTELTTLESKVNWVFSLLSGCRGFSGELGWYSQYSAQLWPRSTLQGCVEIWELLSHHVSAPKTGWSSGLCLRIP